MAFAAVLCLVLVLFSPAFCGSVSNQLGLHSGPENVAVLAGESTTLACVIKGGGAHIRWYEYVTNPSGVLISDGRTLQSNHPNVDRYELVLTDSKTVSLKIKNINLNDAGYYQCQDANAAPSSTERLGAQLVVIEALPNCTQTFHSDDSAIEGEYHTLKCSVGYRATAGIVPLMTWSGPGTFQQQTITTNIAVSASIRFLIHRNLTAQNWICKTNFTTSGFGGLNSATNAPTWQHLDPTNKISVHWIPTNVTVSPLLLSYHVGQTIKCSADASPEATFSWQSLRTSERWLSDSITLREDMIGYQFMRCTAQNTIQGRSYTRDLFVDVTVKAPPSTTTTTPVPTFSPIVPCDDITGRWEIAHPDGARSALCINVNHEGLVHGLWWNNTNDLISSKISGTTDEEFYDIVFLTKRKDRVGVTLFAGKCQKCGDVESLYLHVIHQSNSDQETCATKGTVLQSDKWKLERVAAVPLCPSSYAAMKKTLIKTEAQLPVRQRREMVLPVLQ